MKGNRVLILILFLLLLILLGLGGLFLWLTGGDVPSADKSGEEPVQGFVHVRTMYTADGENLYRPVGIGADGEGSFFVTLRDDQRVVEFDNRGNTVRVWGERGLEQGQLMVPVGVDADRLSGHVYVTDRSRLRLLCYSYDGKFLWEIPLLNPLTPVVSPGGVIVTTFGPVVELTAQGETVRETGTRGHGGGQFDYARAAAVTGDDVIIADSNNNRVQRVKLTGESTATTVWVDGDPPRFQDDPKVSYGLPSGVAVDDDGRAYVLDGFRHEIAVLDARSGKRIHTFENLQGRGDGRFNLPTGIAYLGDDYFAITDTYNDRVQIVRLLIPGEDTVVARYPWTRVAIPLLLLLPLLFILGRKRWYATEEALAFAESDGRLRLLAAVGRRLHMLPEVHARFAEVVEAGVELGDYFVAVGEEDGEDSDAVKRLMDASKPRGLRAWMLPRVRIIVVDADQAEEFESAAGRRVTVEDLTEAYALPGETRSVAAETTTRSDDTDD